MNVFSGICYKDIIKKKLEDCKIKLGNNYSFQKMAHECSIQKTYLSKIMNNQGSHFNSDQLFSICQFLGLSQEETEFTLMLLELSRSNSKKRKSFLASKIKEIRKDKLNTNSYIKSESLSKKEQLKRKYYLNPYFQLVHMFLTIPKFSKDFKSIQNRLGLDQKTFHEVLNTLEELEIITILKNHVICHKTDLHLDENSEVFTTYSTAIKAISLNKSHCTSKEDQYNFSVFFSADESTKNEIRTEFLTFLRTIKPKVEKAPPKNVYQISFDLMNW